MAKGKWIWYPDDFEIELSNKFMAQRYERDVIIPPFWKQSSCYKNIKFIKQVTLKEPETVCIQAEGLFNVELNGAYVYNLKNMLTLPAGEIKIVVSVYNDKGIPCLRVDGENVYTDDTWFATCNNHVYNQTKCDNCLIEDGKTPNTVKLPTKEIKPVQTLEIDGRTVYDFGKEIFATVVLQGVECVNNPIIYYGESLLEVCDIEHCELFSTDVKKDNGCAYTEITKAFRYVMVEGVEFNSIKALFEYLPLEDDNYFECNDKLINEIYDVAKYTLALNTREFLIDGIKRDRWVWGGDAYQSYLMHFYSFFNKPVIKRTMIALFGKSPFDVYINHIMDYSFIWIISFYDYYKYTGDAEFIKDNVSKVFEIMDYCLGRRDENGLMDSRPGDWVFVDWANLDNSGEVCFEQVLMIIALRYSIFLAENFGYENKAKEYTEILSKTETAVDKFWDEEKQAYVHSFKNGKSDGVIVKQPNLLVVLFDMCNQERKKAIIDNVLKNPQVPAITTPYMRFYELAACCDIGETEYVLDEIRSYWGGMIEEGATTFWEAYDKTQKDEGKYAMYGRRYGKSLCHAWGATPLYLIGKYIVGLMPENFGKSFVIKPNLAGLTHFKAKMPLTEGNVEINVSERSVSVLSTKLDGKLVWDGKEYPVLANQKVEIFRK